MEGSTPSSVLASGKWSSKPCLKAKYEASEARQQLLQESMIGGLLMYDTPSIDPNALQIIQHEGSQK